MTIISPSILASDFLNLETEIKRLNDCEEIWVHLDIMDGHFVPNLTFGHDFIEQITAISKHPIDAHFMVTNPEFYIESLKNISIHNFTFHLEATNDCAALIQEAKKYFPSVGISIKPNTPTTDISDDVLKLVDLVLVMSVEPGFGGQKFQNRSIEKITQIKNRRNDVSIQIDGGVNKNNAPTIIQAGANNLVAGSYLFKQKNLKEAVKSLR